MTPPEPTGTFGGEKEIPIPIPYSYSLALGWIGIAALQQVLSESEALPLVLTVAGGLMYTFGAVVLLRRRPDSNPLVLGYHEIWHALGVAASASHYAAITVLLRTGG